MPATQAIPPETQAIVDVYALGGVYSRMTMPAANLLVSASWSALLASPSSKSRLPFPSTTGKNGPAAARLFKDSVERDVLRCDQPHGCLLMRAMASVLLPLFRQPFHPKLIGGVSRSEAVDGGPILRSRMGRSPTSHGWSRRRRRRPSWKPPDRPTRT